MLGLFRQEVEAHNKTLTDGLLALEQDPGLLDDLESMMRAAHSIKGAARMVGVDAAVGVAHVMEDLFVAAQQGQLLLATEHVDELLKSVDLLGQIGELDGELIASWSEQNSEQVATRVAALEALLAGEESEQKSAPEPVASTTAPAAVNLADATMLGLFRVEIETHNKTLTEALLALEKAPSSAEDLESMMRAAHSIKGAARMVGVDAAVRVAHVMEDVFVAAQKGELDLLEWHIDTLLKGVDMLGQIGAQDDAVLISWQHDNANEVAALESQLQRLLDPDAEPPAAPAVEQLAPVETDAERSALITAESDSATSERSASPAADKPSAKKSSDSSLRVTASVLNRLMGYAGEAQVEAGNLRPFAESLLKLRHRQVELLGVLEELNEAMEGAEVDEFGLSLLGTAIDKAGECRQILTERLTDLDAFERRNTRLADRLSREVISSRMRPFIEGVHGFNRMVRDISKSLGKEVKFEIRGKDTKVDRDILDKIEAPLNHMVRNALDHGLETPEERLAAGKPAEGRLLLEAVHNSGMLSIIVKDDGRGVDQEALRKKIVARGMVSEQMATDLSESELLDFLFLPSFSTREQVSEISGRGVGLDVVHSTMQEMRGVLHATSTLGEGMRIHLQLPLSLSTIRALMIDVGGESYAVPLARIERTMMVPRDQLKIMEGRQYVIVDEASIGLLQAHQVLEVEGHTNSNELLPVIVIGDRNRHYGVVVEQFLGERNLVVQVLDARLGKVQDIAAASILEDGTPTLIIDVDDMLRSIELLISGGRLMHVGEGVGEKAAPQQGKRILVVDDSITVREVERNMLETKGYSVDVAVDGMDGWNAIRVGNYDLVISDVDMPRMNGIEFVSKIKSDARLSSTPTMIVSYKDREEDRQRGLEAGADYYLAKGSFHDETLIEAVVDLIGEA
ncbi:hypothetical protein BOW53_05180 [Solemya pervernicosa gill symbiont]|uniref:Chemotaxis protein CheA n=2 Tax=Solemya pervernicosa gill symbiont TaxID=642797 RepID=A0A1T2L7Q9_9GAMM|nr:hypothetical protein BOW53_05180 [Solemya pervernicosa gill symbiont]